MKILPFILLVVVALSGCCITLNITYQLPQAAPAKEVAPNWDEWEWGLLPEYKYVDSIDIFDTKTGIKLYHWDGVGFIKSNDNQ
jgi:hypothetical protein